MLLRTLLTWLVLAPLLPATLTPDDPSPTFVPGDLDKLAVKVVTKRSADNEGLLTLEVRNRSRLWAEPLAFQVTLQPARSDSKLTREHSLMRLPRPRAGRAGRAVRPGGTLEYQVPQPYIGDERVKWQASVREASFFEGEGYDECPVELSEVTQSRATLTNTCDRPVRVFLRAPHSENRPRLFAEDLDPGEQRQVGADTRPAMFTSLPPEFPPVYGTVESLEIVDWSVLVDAGEVAARRSLRDAWNASARWVEPRSALHGEVQYTLEGAAWNLPDKGYRGRAAFVLHPQTGVQLESSRSLEAEERNLLSASLAQAFQPLTRPPFAEWAGDQVFQLDDGTGHAEVFLPRADSGGVASMMRTYELRGGLIHRCLGEGVHSVIVQTVQHRPGPDGLALEVLRAQGNETFGKRYPQERQTRRYEFTQGLPWVAEYLDERFAGEGVVHGRVQLDLSAVRFEAPGLPVGPPAGSGAEDLRAAWEEGYRYPDGMRVEARFTVDTKDQPADWLKNRQTRGRFTFEGWRGGSPAYDSGVVEVQDQDTETASTLASLFRARQSIWTRQDPCGRRPFDEVFAGAVIEPRRNQPGVYDVDHPHVREVRLHGGRVVALGYTDGREQQWKWAERHDRLVPVELQTHFGDTVSTTTLEWGELDPGQGWLFPEQVTIEDWFYEGWGPEVYGFRWR